MESFLQATILGWFENNDTDMLNHLRDFMFKDYALKAAKSFRTIVYVVFV